MNPISFEPDSNFHTYDSEDIILCLILTSNPVKILSSIIFWILKT